MTVHEVVNPATEKVVASVNLATEADATCDVAAATIDGTLDAFDAFWRERQRSTRS